MRCTCRFVVPSINPSINQFRGAICFGAYCLHRPKKNEPNRMFFCRCFRFVTMTYDTQNLLNMIRLIRNNLSARTFSSSFLSVCGPSLDFDNKTTTNNNGGSCTTKYTCYCYHTHSAYSFCLYQNPNKTQTSPTNHDGYILLYVACRNSTVTTTG